MKQKQINTVTGAINAAQMINLGITELGASVFLPRSPQADIVEELTNIIVACGNLEQAKQVKATRRNALVDAINESQKFVRLVRDFLKSIFGNEYSDLWTVVGFSNGLGVPDVPEDLKRILLAMVSHLTANPSLEVGTVVTAARAQAMHDALQAAQHALMSQEANVEALMNTRDQKYEIVRKRISDVYQELRLELDPLDPRWLKFGFNMPGADETPEMPTGLLATLIGPTAVALKWEAAERAAYYRVYKKVTGVDENYVAVGSPADLDFTIENLPAGATVEIQITAVNTGGESSRTEAVTVIMHA